MSARFKRAALGVGLVMLALWVAYFALVPRAGPASKAIGSAVKERGRQTIAVSTFTRFGWDEMVVIGGYEGATEGMKQHWCMRNSFSADQCSEVAFAPISEAWQTLMFRERGEIVHSELHARVNGDFWLVGSPLLPAQAVFEVLLSRELLAGKPWPYLVQQGAPRPAGSVPVAQWRAAP